MRPVEKFLPPELELFFTLHTSNTARAYRQDIDDFFTHLSKPIWTATPIDVVTWIAGMKSRGLSDATIHRRYHAARAILNYLVDLEALDRNPCGAAKRAISWRQQQQRRPTATLTAAEVRKVLSVQVETDPQLIRRDKALLSLAFGAGLRRSELQRLNVQDFKGSHLVVRLAKSGKPEAQEIPAWVRAPVYRLAAARKREGGGDALFVFYYTNGKPGRRLSDSTIYRIFKNYFAAAGIKAAPHACRAAAATQLKRLGLEDRAVADFLRHKTTLQVQIYDKRARSERQGAGLKLKY